MGKENKHYWIYTLRLEQGKYYVGITSRKNPQTRIDQHIQGFYSAQWVKKYRPVDIIEIINIGFLNKTDAEKLELKRTLQYMKKYGYQNVRGGKLNYSGKYIKLGDRFIQDQDFQTILVVLTLLIIIVGLFFTTFYKR